MDLYRGEDYFRFSTGKWKRLLRLLKIYAWKPLGTRYQDDADCRGGYEGNDGQTVTADDSLAMAAAIERVLTRYPREDAEKTVELQLKTNLWAPPHPDQRARLESYMEKGDEAELEQFMAFYRAGAFKIW